MEAVLEWLYFLAKLILLVITFRIIAWLLATFVEKFWKVSLSFEGVRFLYVHRIIFKSQSLELELRDVSLRLRWFHSFEKFFQILIDCVIVQQKSVKTTPPIKEKQQTATGRPGLKRRALYKLLRWFAKSAELQVQMLEYEHRDYTNELEYLDVVQLDKGFHLILQPLADRFISVQVAVPQLSFQSLLAVSMESSDDYTYILMAEGSVNCTIFAYLSLLAVARPVDSVQFTLSSVESQLHGIKSLVQLKSRFSKAPASSRANNRSQSQKLPQRIEVVLNEASLNYRNDNEMKSVRTTLNKLSLTMELPQSTLSLRGLTVKSLPNIDLFNFSEILTQCKYSPDDLELGVSLNSVKCHAHESHLLYWSKHFKTAFENMAPPSSPKEKRRDSPLLIRLYHLLPSSFSLISKLELSDCIVNIDLDNREMTPPKGPFASLVAVGGVLKVTRQSRVVGVTGQLKDSYLRLSAPPTVDHTPDDPEILPSSSHHVWGRVVSVGSMTFGASLSMATNGSDSTYLRKVVLKGCGQSLVLECSDLTLQTLSQLVKHLKSRYSGRHDNVKSRRGDATPTHLLINQWRDIIEDLSFTIESTNILLYQRVPTPLLLFLRTDSCSLQKDRLEFYGMAADEMSHGLPNYFQCLSVCNLPNSGLMDIDQCSLEYTQDDLHTRIGKLVINWNTLRHCTVCNLLSSLSNKLKELISNILGTDAQTDTSTAQTDTGTSQTDTSTAQTDTSTSQTDTSAAQTDTSAAQTDTSAAQTDTSAAQTDTSTIITLGDRLQPLLSKISTSLYFELEDGYVHLHLKGTKISINVKTSHCSIKDCAVSVDSQIVDVQFDGHHLLVASDFLSQCPYEGPVDDRNQLPWLQTKTNTVVSILATQVELLFPYQYKFYAAYEMLTATRKYLQNYHRSSSSSNRSAPPLFLMPDILLEIEELAFCLEDDWFEVKMRANYELMSDEYEQRQMRLESLNDKLRVIKDNQGLLSQVSGKRVHDLYESLEETNDTVYCHRAIELYSVEPLRTQLLTIGLSQTRLLCISDPSLIGHDKLTNVIREIDSVSSLPGQYQFSTLWGTYISLINEHMEVHIRDYPWKLLEGEAIGIEGRLVFAEQEAQEGECVPVDVPVGFPWEKGVVTLKLPPLKYYHDINITADNLEVSWGPGLDPSFAQINYSFNFITKPSRDPSPPLPWWDKLRLLLHGKADLQSSQLIINVLSSYNPYNTSEYIELRLLDIEAQLLDNVSLSITGAVQGYVHTASRYDECQFFSLPSVSAQLDFTFNCSGEKHVHDHHFVVRQTADRSDQDHDSYKDFRSLSIDLGLSLTLHKKEENQPEVLLYASTLRWLQLCVDVIRGHVSRPIKRGTVHKNVRPRKKRFTRHLRHINLEVKLPSSLVNYWSSVRKQEGIELSIQELSFKISYTLSLVPFTDGLKRRPRANWGMSLCEGKVGGVRGYTCIKQTGETELLEEDPYIISNRYVSQDDESKERMEKYFLLELDSLSYIWQHVDESTQEFTHQLKALNSRLVWNNESRSIVYKILDTYRLHKRLKQDLSTEALQSVLTKWETAVAEIANEQNDAASSKPVEESRRRLTRHSSGIKMLDQLLSDICNTIVSSSEEQREASDPKLKGIVAANRNDVNKHNWFIELMNTQVALKGVEKKGFVVCSSYIAQVFGRDHLPEWREGDLVSKTSWVAKVQDLQYFSTIDANDDYLVPWLPLSVIQPPAARDTPRDEESLTAALLSQLGPDLAHPVGVEEMMSSRPPGEAVGGIIESNPSSGLLIEDIYGNSQSAAAATGSGSGNCISLQRIASRCHCQMFYVTFGGQVQADHPPSTSDLLSPSHENFTLSHEAVDTFTFRYPSVEVCTTSEQYSLILDILNKLLLYKEPRKKEATEQHARINFKMQLSSTPDIRKPVLTKQNKIRQILKKLKSLENELYIEQKSGTDSSLQARENLESELTQAKDNLSQASLELRAMIRAFKEKKFFMSPARSESATIAPEPVRRIEVWLDDAQWALMQDDGQLQISEIKFSNFSYNRITFNDDSGEHRIELGSFRVKNCIPNTPAIYQEVLSPFDPQSRRLRVDKNVSLRIFCRDRAPVAGIPVTEHLEINVVPLAVRLTEKFYQTVQEFFLPRAESEIKETSEPDHSHVFGGHQPTFHTDIPDGASFSRSSSTRRSGSTPSVVSAPGVITSPPDSPSTNKESHQQHQRKTKRSGRTVDEVATMQARASNIKTFIYVKIPQLTLCITYKGDSISVKEMHEQLVTVPTLQYHDLHMSWQSLLLEFKKDYKSAIIAQTIKSAIGMKESEEKAGLSSPKLGRSDILMGKPIKEGKAKSSRRLFTKKGGDSAIEEEERTSDITDSPKKTK